MAEEVRPLRYTLNNFMIQAENAAVAHQMAFQRIIDQGYKEKPVGSGIWESPDGNSVLMMD